MHRLILVLALLFCALPATTAQVTNPWQRVIPVRPDGTVLDPMHPLPFRRAGDPSFLPATTTPTQFAITQPAGTSSYRFVNPCDVDIRIKTVASMSESVSVTSGTRFLSRTVETLSSSPNPNPGQTRYVSIMAVEAPEAPCMTELGYGSGG